MPQNKMSQHFLVRTNTIIVRGGVVIVVSKSNKSIICIFFTSKRMHMHTFYKQMHTFPKPKVRKL